MGRGTWSDSTTEDGRARNTKARHEECRFEDRRATDWSPRLSDPALPAIEDPLASLRADCTLVPPPLQRWTRFPAGPATA